MLNFVCKRQLYYQSPCIQALAWCQIVATMLPGPMMTQFIDTCLWFVWPQWVEVIQKKRTHPQQSWVKVFAWQLLGSKLLPVLMLICCQLLLSWFMSVIIKRNVQRFLHKKLNTLLAKRWSFCPGLSLLEFYLRPNSVKRSKTPLLRFLFFSFFYFLERLNFKLNVLYVHDVPCSNHRTSNVHTKGQGPRSRSQRSKPNLAVSDRNSKFNFTLKIDPILSLSRPFFAPQIHFSTVKIPINSGLDWPWTSLPFYFQNYFVCNVVVCIETVKQSLICCSGTVSQSLTPVHTENTQLKWNGASYAVVLNLKWFEWNKTIT